MHTGYTSTYGAHVLLELHECADDEEVVPGSGAALQHHHDGGRHVHPRRQLQELYNTTTALPAHDFIKCRSDWFDGGSIPTTFLLPRVHKSR